MIPTEKYDKQYIGAVAGFLLPVVICFFVYFFSTGNHSLEEYLQRIVFADILTHIISLCVFPNIIIFLIFNRLDMLRATRGVLGITIFWAILVFAVKFIL